MFENMNNCEPVMGEPCSPCTKSEKETIQTMQCKTRDCLIKANDIANSIMSCMFAEKAETSEINVDSLYTSTKNIGELSYQLLGKMEYILRNCFE